MKNLNKILQTLVLLILVSTVSKSQTGLIPFTVTQLPPPATPTITPSGSTAICQGNSLTLVSSAATGNTWSNGATGNFITVTTAGSYSVTVSANGCTATSNPVSVTTTSISISITQTNPSCGSDNGSATASISGGTAPYTIQWSNGDFGNTADSLFSGQYVVQVTDANGCYASKVVNLNSSNGPSVLNQFQNNVTCPGGNNGGISVNAGGGTAPLTYLWSTGATSTALFNLPAGVYDLEITDANGCIANASFTITQPNPFSVSFSSVPPTCGSTSGSITANVSGGTGSYSYSWSANAGSQTTQTASNISAGVYTVQIQDNANCPFSATGILATSSAGPALSSSVTPSGGCGASAAGSIDLSVSGGVSPYSYQWSNGAITQDISSLAPGTYSVVVSGADGCTSVDSILVPNASGNLNPELCIVSVDTTTNTNLVVWEKPGVANGIKEYKIYRENSVANVFNLIRTVPFNSLSEITDSVADPQVRGWRYKLASVDSCGVITPLSLTHKTIHLMVNNGVGGVKNLAWDNYEGFPVGTFYILRFHTSTGWVKIDSLPSNLTSYTDVNPPGGGTLSYAIEVVSPVPCTSTLRTAEGGMNVMGTIVKTRSNVKNNRLIGINELDIEKYFRIYPVPASNQLFVEWERGIRLRDLELSNSLGQSIIKQAINTTDNKVMLNVSDLKAGIYFVRLSTEKGNSIKKVVIE